MRAFERWPFLRWLLAVAPVLVLVALAQIAQSRVIYGTRYFWLDDDQMISMRYARNLVEGHGLVFNAGERVEGYSNPLWTLMLAALHLLGVGEAKVSLLPKLANGVAVAATALGAVRIASLLAPRAARAAPLLVFTVIVSIDVLFWAFQGFETTVLTALFTLGTAEALRDEPRSVALVAAIGLLPLVRSDAYHLLAALALLLFLRHGVTRRTCAIVALALVVPVVHVVWRRAYYGEWLPNTYYLKVVGLGDRTRRAAGYAARFGGRYAVPLVLAGVAFFLRRDRVRAWVLVAVAACLLHVLATGGDVFGNLRYFAPIVPLLLASAFAIASELSDDAQRYAPWALTACLWLSAGTHDPHSLASGNGFVEESVVAGVAIARHARPDATIAVVAAGAVSYFGRRHAIDTLGKTDREIARMAARGEGPIGHQKYDYDAVLARRPDLVVALLPFAKVGPDVCAWNREYALALPCSREFQRYYSDHGVEILGLPNVRVFAREGTPEALVRSWGTP